MDAIGAYHTRRVVPLMTRALPLYLMALSTSSEGTMLAEEVPSDDGIARRIRDATEPMQDTEGTSPTSSI